jgi:hypothetical protein
MKQEKERKIVRKGMEKEGENKRKRRDNKLRTNERKRKERNTRKRKDMRGDSERMWTMRITLETHEKTKTRNETRMK